MANIPNAPASNQPFVNPQSGLINRVWFQWLLGIVGNATTGGTVTNTGTLTAHHVMLGNGGVDIHALGGIGTAGQLLTSNGAAADPSFQDASASGIVTLTGMQTLTNKRITARVVTVTDATSITPNTDSADVTYQLNTQAAGTLTVNADGGTPTNAQRWTLKIKSTNVQTFSWNGVYVGGTIALPVATTGSGKIDYFDFRYDTVASKWDFVSSALGF